MSNKLNMSQEKNNDFEKVNNLESKNPEKEINKLAYSFLKKYSEKKEVIDKLMTFETSKWLKEFKKEIDILKNQWKIEKKVKAEELFLAIKEAKNKIAKLARNEIEKLRSSLNNKEFTPNKNYDLAEKIKTQNPDLYQAITSPKWFKQQLASAGFWIANSIYKTWAWIKTLWVDTFKLLTFQVPLEQIKEQFKKV